MFNALGVTALMPLSFNIEASPALTENVEQEFRRERPVCGVAGALNNGKSNQKINKYSNLIR